MKITKRTKVDEVLPFLTEERLEAITKVIPERKLKKNLLECTVGEFCRIISGDEDFINNKIIGRTRNAIKYFGRFKEFKKQMNMIERYLSSNKVKTSEIEENASRNVRFLSPPEQILLTCQKAYYLHSLKEAEGLPLSNYLVIALAQSAEQKYNQNLQKEYERERKLKSK